MVQTNDAATIITVLPTSATVPPGANALARRNTAGNYLQSRPTGNTATLLKATVINSTPGALASVDITYNLDTFNQIAENGAIAFQVYYSFDGLPGNWQLISSLSGDNVAGLKGVTLDLSATPWAPNATMYILFADDNDNGSTDPSYTIDNFAVSTPGVPPNITLDPISQTVEQCRSVTFRSQASGSPPMSFQWYKDGVAMDPLANPTATGTTLIISNAQSGDAGNYFMRASNPSGTDDSLAATLTYQPDTTPPSIVSAVFDPFDPTRVTVTFSEQINYFNALDTFNWSLFETGNPDNIIPINVIAFTTAASNQLALTLDAPRNPALSYTVTASAIDDECVLNQANVSSTIGSAGLGFRQGANGYTGTQDTEIHEATPDTPAGDLVEWGVDNEDPAPNRIRGLLRFDSIFGGNPGQIPFGSFISNATLTLVTEDLGGNPILIFRMLTDWNEATTTWNTMGGGIDDGTNGTEAVFFGTVDPTPDDAPDVINVTSLVQDWANGAANFGWAFVATTTDGWDVHSSEAGVETNRPTLLVQYREVVEPCSILDHPDSVTVNECGNFTLSVAASGTGLTYQWKRNGADIPGATASSYTVNGAKPSLHNGAYTVVVSGTVPPSPCTSQPATVTVTPDSAGPTVASAVGNPGQTTITITLSDQCPVNATDAQTTANYTVSGGVTVNSAVLAGSVVTLTTSARSAGVNYSLTIRNIRDTSDAQNPLSPNPTVIGTLLQRVQVLPRNSTWRYSNVGADLYGADPTWKDPGYNDSGWPSAQQLLGLETTAGTFTALFNQGWDTNNMTLLLRTNSVGGGLNGTNITDYFRTTVNIPFSLAGAVIEIRHAIDDGAAFYFNGTEVGTRFNLPAGALTSLTEAPAAAGEGVTRTMGGLTGLNTGNNTIAVSVHQNGFASTDVLFGAEVLAIYGATPPTLTIVNNGNGTVTISWTPSGGTLQQSTNLSTWTNTANQANPQTITASGAGVFYRVAP
jgi:hypothetical protein